MVVQFAIMFIFLLHVPKQSKFFLYITVIKQSIILQLPASQWKGTMTLSTRKMTPPDRVYVNSASI